MRKGYYGLKRSHERKKREKNNLYDQGELCFKALLAAAMLFIYSISDKIVIKVKGQPIEIELYLKKR